MGSICLLFICFARVRRGLHGRGRYRAEIMHFADDLSKSTYRFFFHRRPSAPQLLARIGSAAGQSEGLIGVRPRWLESGTAIRHPVRMGSLASAESVFRSRLARRLSFDLADRVFKGEALTLIEGQPDLTLDEVVCAMRKRKLPGSRTAVWRFFQRHKITFKKKPERGGAAARRRGAGAATLDARTGHV